LARTEGGEGLHRVPDGLGDDHLARLEDEHLLPGLTLVEEHGSLGKLLPEPLEERVLGSGHVGRGRAGEVNQLPPDGATSCSAVRQAWKSSPYTAAVRASER